MSATKRSIGPAGFHRILERAERVRATVRMFRHEGDRIDETEQSVAVTDPDAVKELRGALRVARSSKAACGCIDQVTFALFDASGRRLASVPWHGSHLRRLPMLYLVDAAAPGLWLERHGLVDPFRGRRKE